MAETRRPGSSTVQRRSELNPLRGNRARTDGHHQRKPQDKQPCRPCARADIRAALLGHRKNLRLPNIQADSTSQVCSLMGGGHLFLAQIECARESKTAMRVARHGIPVRGKSCQGQLLGFRPTRTPCQSQTLDGHGDCAEGSPPFSTHITSRLPSGFHSEAPFRQLSHRGRDR